MFALSYKKLSLIAVGLCMILTACAKQEPIPQPLTMEQLCPIPESKIINEAVIEAENILSNADCVSRFEVVFQHLIQIAQNDPNPENFKLFSNFLVWAKDNSIISTRQSKEIYTKYFSYNFVALPRDYQTCSSCKNIDKIIRQMDAELRLKDIGLMKICQNKAKYVRAKSDHTNMKLILKAVCRACQGGD